MAEEIGRFFAGLLLYLIRVAALGFILSLFLANFPGLPHYKFGDCCVMVLLLDTVVVAVMTIAVPMQH